MAPNTLGLRFELRFETHNWRFVVKQSDASKHCENGCHLSLWSKSLAIGDWQSCQSKGSMCGSRGTRTEWFTRCFEVLFGKSMFRLTDFERNKSGRRRKQTNIPALEASLCSFPLCCFSPPPCWEEIPPSCFREPKRTDKDWLQVMTLKHLETSKPAQIGTSPHEMTQESKQTQKFAPQSPPSSVSSTGANQHKFAPLVEDTSGRI